MRRLSWLVPIFAFPLATGCFGPSYYYTPRICDPAGPGQLILPDSGQTNVPQNTWIWGPSQAPTLKDATGETIPLTQVFSQGLLKAYAPAGPLKAGKTYSFEAGFGYSLYQFTVGESVLTSPPALPVVTGPMYAPLYDDFCGWRSYLAAFDLTFSPNTLAVSDFAQKAPVGRTYATLNWDATYDYFSTNGIAKGELYIGAGIDDNWPSVGPGSQTDVRFGVYDLAGNFSGWTGYTHVTIPTQ